MGSTRTKFRQRFHVNKSYVRTYACKYNEGSLGRGKAGFFGHFFREGHQGAFSFSIKIIDERCTQWPNERATDIELDMFACGTA